jgi:hypothetical protein
MEERKDGTLEYWVEKKIFLSIIPSFQHSVVPEDL